MRLLKIIPILGFILPLSTAFASIDSYFDQIKTDRAAMYQFLKAMPKGGELHYHFTGSGLAENVLHLAQTGRYCLDPTNDIMRPMTSLCKGIPSSQLSPGTPYYESIIRAWSMKDFVPNHETSHDHFFACFMKFSQLYNDYASEIFAQELLQAAAQNELYLELIHNPNPERTLPFGDLLLHISSLAKKRAQLLSNPAFIQNIQTNILETEQFVQRSRKLLHCDTKPHQPVCNMRFKFQYFAYREQPLNQVFAQLLTGFEVATRSPLFVGVNLVQAEDGPRALQDYHQQMQLLHYFHQQYPQVHIALHAGELVPGLVPNQDLRFHIEDAILTGHAERIGHGVDILHETHAEATLKQMAKKPIPVEINLTSNEKILNISGKQHPLLTYLKYQVPVVLSTDDEGILRTDLTTQYIDAVDKYGLDYPTIKNINRNALTYSFTSGKSLWQDPIKHIPVFACKILDSAPCLAYIQQYEKAHLEWTLEKNLAVFEARYEHAL